MAPVALWLVAATVSFVDGRLVVFPLGVYVAGMAAAFLLGKLSRRAPRPDRAGRRARCGARSSSSTTLGTSPASSSSCRCSSRSSWLAGFALREHAAQAEAAEERAARAEREREENARRAVFEERVRIARELHDVVAHHVSMMGVQAGAARVVHRPRSRQGEGGADRDRDVQPPGGRWSCTACSGSCARRATATTWRRNPGSAQLPRLAASMGDSDLAVAVSIEGEQRALPSTVDVSAYRIVQEALTNTLKHSTASRADVHVRYWPDELELEIVDDGRPEWRRIAGDRAGSG